MELEQLFLRKEELPILYKSCFQVPIHPKLLDKDIKIDETIAQRLFPQVAEEWYEDLKNYSPESNLEKEWIDNLFLKEKPEITKHFDHQIVNKIWRDDVNFMDNGLVQCFSICRNAGGSIYFREDDNNCESLIPNMYMKLLEEKAKEFEYKKVGEYSIARVYSQHNVDAYPGALFLRNWAVMYMNEVFRQVFKN